MKIARKVEMFYTGFDDWCLVWFQIELQLSCAVVVVPGVDVEVREGVLGSILVKGGESFPQVNILENISSGVGGGKNMSGIFTQKSANFDTFNPPKSVIFVKFFPKMCKS